MKRITSSILLVLCLAFVLTGCAKCISTEYESVKVRIVDKFYQGARVIPVSTGKTITTHAIPPVYRITVEYNGVEYTISGSDTYDKYKEMIGYTAIGTLEICTYDDGSISYDIISLE